MRTNWGMPFGSLFKGADVLIRCRLCQGHRVGDVVSSTL
jgi:hypothetical protein